MLAEFQTQTFIARLLENPPPESIEDIGSYSHETKRVPDPRILLVKNGKLLKLDNSPVDEDIEKDSALGEVEYKAYQKIQDWADKKQFGMAYWFSPILSGTYTTNKIDINEILYSTDGQKVLFKRALLLDVDSNVFLTVVSQFAQKTSQMTAADTENLRGSPLFTETNTLEALLQVIAPYTDQCTLIENGQDLSLKLETYEAFSRIEAEHQHVFTTADAHFHYLRQVGHEKDLIGNHGGSCDKPTAFAKFSLQGKVSSGAEDQYGSLDFPCPHCGRINTRPPGQFLSLCQHCGGNVKC